MSSTASNYDFFRLQAGIAVAVAGVLLAGTGLYRGSEVGMRCPSSTVVFGIVATIAYCIMMFASSFVEEEQQFWYWITGGWFIWVYAQRSGISSITQWMNN